MIRDDLSNKLIHLVRGETTEEALRKLVSIMRSRQLIGGTGFIKGKYQCVCFTEAPIAKLGYMLANPELAKMRYRPFGVMIDKKYAFSMGARPAIYQPDEDFDKLDESIRYRHVRFELDNSSYPIDLTWEREWRVKTETLVLPIESTTIIVPSRPWRDALIERHAELQRSALSMAEDVLIEAYPWHLVVLEDLGIAISDGLEKKKEN